MQDSVNLKSIQPHYSGKRMTTELCDITYRKQLCYVIHHYFLPVFVFQNNSRELFAADIYYPACWIWVIDLTTLISAIRRIHIIVWKRISSSTNIDLMNYARIVIRDTVLVKCSQWGRDSVCFQQSRAIEC